ncbi:MAG: type II secretion system protein GspG [Proteobacteria bacterium]|nr:type II secretion system protein GspG [Pseudomonadota bacterium]
MHTQQSPKNAGFTLMELLVVVVILGVLATFVAPKFFSQPEKARRTTAELQVKKIAEALEMYKLDNRKYPTTDQGLKALVEKPTSGPEAENWQKGGYMPNMPKDPWGNDYVYLQPGVHGDFDIISYGADGKKGGTDENADVTSWKK